MSRSVKELTTSIAHGDRDAFAEFYRGWFKPMYAEAKRVTAQDEAFCLDVVQDAMLRVIRSLRPVDTERQLAAWIKTVVRTSAYDRLKGEGRRRRYERSAPARDHNPRVDADLKDRLAWLRREIVELDAPAARLLVMRYRLGWTLERMGSVMGLQPGAVDGRLRRIITKLRKRARETIDG